MVWNGFVVETITISVMVSIVFFCFFQQGSKVRFWMCIWV